MKKIINLILVVIILITLYIVSIFLFPEQIKKISSFLWLDSFNDSVLDIKWKIDNISINTDIDKTIKNIQSWATDLLDTAWDYAKDIKSKIDSVRSTASWVENTYNEVKWQIEETRKNIEDVSNKFNEMKQTVDSVNIFN